MAFDVVGIGLQNFLRELLGFTDDVGSIAAAYEIVVTELNASFQVCFVDAYGSPQRIQHFRKALETFVSLGQAPLRRSKFVVDLDRVTKFERSFLKLLIFQVSFASRDVVCFGLFGVGAAGQKNYSG